MKLPSDKQVLSKIRVWPQINQTYKNLQRTRKILLVFAKHGFFQIIEELGLAKLVPFYRSENPKNKKLSKEQRLCNAFEELGPTFIKLGQMFSSRPDLVGYQTSRAFSRLKDKVKPIAFKEIRKTIEHELECSIEDVFDDFEEKPIATASISQVHGALCKDGSRVVVKVQKPKVQKLIETDLSILHFMAKLAEKSSPEFEALRPMEVVTEFSHLMRDAVDFMEEAKNTDIIRKNFEKENSVVIPKVYWELSSKRVLTLERIEGTSLTHLKKLKAQGFDLKKICKIGTDAFFQQVFIDGFFHTDLHEGNLIVLSNQQIAFVDFGEIGKLGSNAQKSLATLFTALFTHDYYSLAREYVELSRGAYPVDFDKFADDLEKQLRPLHHGPSIHMNLGKTLAQAASIAHQYQVQLPRDLILVGRVVMAVESMIYKLYPEFDLLEESGKYAQKFSQKNFSAHRMGQEVFWNAKDINRLLKELPSHFRYVLKKLSHNELKIGLELDGLSKLVSELDRASNRLAFSLIIAGLIIGSSILTFSDKGPKYLSVPILGIAGYILAGVFGLGLIISMIRSRKL
ncbi:MAG: AarF/ABC1/UbiB kinase family protein [Bdellovibrionales bacterium]|nr:AarF/ABC1/UbiB kinase family protein [Bdellovibrionales bacterium]